MGKGFLVELTWESGTKTPATQIRTWDSGTDRPARNPARPAPQFLPNSAAGVYATGFGLLWFFPVDIMELEKRREG